MLAVPVNFTLTLPSGRKTTAAAVTRLIPATAWETRSCGRGCKGHRDYAWAWAATASPRHQVLIRRSLSDPSDLAFYYCHAPAGWPVSLPVLIKVAGKRWPVEECLQQGKGQTGLDQHQVRTWHSFCRHTVLSMCAQALLAIAAARPASPGQAGDDPPAGDGQPAAWRGTGKLPASADDEPPGDDPGLVKVSVPEARRLARLATAPMTRAARDLGYAWSRLPGLLIRVNGSAIRQTRFEGGRRQVSTCSSWALSPMQRPCPCRLPGELIAAGMSCPPCGVSTVLLGC